MCVCVCVCVCVCRNERYKLVWGMPGQQDGWYLDTDFMYNMEYYQNVVGNWTLENGNETLVSGEFVEAEDRGGPYHPTEEQQYVLDTYMKIVAVTEEQFDTGTGQMWLFDLQGRRSGSGLHC